MNARKACARDAEGAASFKALTGEASWRILARLIGQNHLYSEGDADVKNPWNSISVPSDDYVHPIDKEVWTRPCSHPPQPYLGDYIEGRVLWLLGGFGTGADMAIERPEYKQRVLSWAQRNLGCDSPCVPNLWLASDIVDGFIETRDVLWWRRATKTMANALSSTARESNVWRILASRLFVLEAFPYPSRTRPNTVLRTHEYSAYLLRAWIRTGRPIVIGRAEHFWCQVEPTLLDAIARNQAIRAKNVQCASISPGNLANGESDFARIIEAMRGA